MSAYVTIYNKETGEGLKIYRATLSDFLDSGVYQVEKPGNYKPSAQIATSELPTAGREANRPEPKEVQATARVRTEETARRDEDSSPEKEAAPAAQKKTPPRRRLTEKSKED